MTKVYCKLCEKETIDNNIGGVWVCSTCYPKFKIVFEHYIPFVDGDKLQELRCLTDKNESETQRDLQPIFEELTKLLENVVQGWYYCLDHQSTLDDMEAIVRTMRLFTK